MYHDLVSKQSPLSRAAFDASLTAWARSASPSETIGDATNFGQRAWIHVLDGGHLYFLNADSTREGVEEYLRIVEQDPEVSWSAVVNNRGRLNKAAFGSDAQVVRKFYLYRAEEA